MFGIGPMELMVLAIVGVIVVGPERLPGFARQAAQLLRTLRELATGAQKQLTEELGPEFADLDLRNLNPRHVVRRAIFDDDFDFDDLDPRKSARKTLVDGDTAADLRAADPRRWLRDDDEPAARSTPARMNGRNATGDRVSMVKPVSGPIPSSGLGVPQPAVDGEAPRPRPRPSPRPRSAYDDDAVT